MHYYRNILVTPVSEVLAEGLAGCQERTPPIQFDCLQGCGKDRNDANEADRRNQYHENATAFRSALDLPVEQDGEGTTQNKADSKEPAELPEGNFIV